MKLVMLVILLLATCSVLHAQQTVWKEFKSTEGGFSVLMPGAPTPNKVSVNTASGVEEAVVFSSNDEKSNEYVVAYSKYSEKDSKKATTDKLFDNARDGIVSFQQGKLLNEAAITLNGYSGRMIAVERPDGVVTIIRFYVVGNHFYQLSAQAKTNERDSRAAKQFLDSFKLLPVK